MRQEEKEEVMMIGSLAGVVLEVDMQVLIIHRHEVATDNTPSWGCFVTPTFHGVRFAATTATTWRLINSRASGARVDRVYV